MSFIKRKYAHYTNQKIFRNGYKRFLETGETPEEAYYAMRKLFVMSNGKFNDDFVKSSLKSQPKISVDDSNSVLSNDELSGIDDIVKGIENDGYYIFDTELNQEYQDKLVTYATEESCSYLKYNEEQQRYRYTDATVNFDPENIISNRYQFSENQLIQNQTVRELMFDSGFFKIAQEYIGVKPVLDLVTMWWSAPFAGKATNEAAQMYHFDMDRIKFLKFFVYLTDVHENNGPHCYVRGSHKRLPSALLADRRITDDEVRENYKKEDILELKGKKGTIMAVDTRGLHKGKTLTQDNRLIFQLEFSNSLFGQNYGDVEKISYPKMKPELKTAYSKYCSDQV